MQQLKSILWKGGDISSRTMTFSWEPRAYRDIGVQAAHEVHGIGRRTTQLSSSGTGIIGGRPRLYGIGHLHFAVKENNI